VIRAAFLSVAAAAMLGLPASPAGAAWTSCTVDPWSTSCTSGTTSANVAGQYIDYSVRGGAFPCYSADYRIVDAANGQTVRSGHVGADGIADRLHGVYTRYYIGIFNSCWDAEGDLGY
jgi:hypothetical protein